MKFYLNVLALVLVVVNLDIKAVAKPKKYLIEIEDEDVTKEEPMAVSFVTKDDENDQDNDAMRAVADGNALFGLRLYSRIKNEDQNNLLMSPYSLSSVMAMVQVGAGTKTKQEIKGGMNFPEMNTLVEGYSDVFRLARGNENFTLETANKLYVKEGFQMKKDFLNILKDSFNSDVTQIDFTARGGEVARQDINDWVEEKTNEKIKDLIPEKKLDGNTKLVLVNAISFKAEWVNKFDRKVTQEEDFFVNGDKIVKVEMMQIGREYFKTRFGFSGDSQVIELPYEGNQVSMYIILPKDKFGLQDVESTANLALIASKLEEEKPVLVRLSLPKFKLEKTIEMVEIMKKLEMTKMFTDMADFSGITEEEKIKVTDVFHKAFIEVNEEGSEANAASAVTFKTTLQQGDPPKIIDFVCNHPFLFFIMDKRTNMILFSGRVVDPTLG